MTLGPGTAAELATGLDHAVDHLDWAVDQQRLAATLDDEPPRPATWTTAGMRDLAHA